MYRRLLAVFIPASLLSISGAAFAAQAENPAPEPSHNHRGGEKRIILENGEDATITLWKPDLSTEPLTLEHGAVTLPKTGMDNYHAILAEKDWGDHKEAVIRYEYRHGPPSKQSPARLAAQQKTEFEIVPDPIPREHYRYHARQEWGFLLRFQGQPVGGLQVVLQTSNGSRLSATTDASGRVKFRIPDDFPGLVKGERDRRVGDFSISSEYLQGNRRFTTQLSADYRVSPVHWQSTRLGLLVVGIGFIAGGFIGRVNKAGEGK
ncbi:MAG: carboxypeptidase-like regulatory domain-containing protein [Candidatus Thiodiazotropha sp.]